jgi:hypothetical protein
LALRSKHMNLPYSYQLSSLFLYFRTLAPWTSNKTNRHSMKRQNLYFSGCELRDSWVRPSRHMLHWERPTAVRVSGSALGGRAPLRAHARWALAGRRVLVLLPSYGEPWCVGECWYCYNITGNHVWSASAGILLPSCWYCCYEVAYWCSSVKLDRKYNVIGNITYNKSYMPVAL